MRLARALIPFGFAMLGMPTMSAAQSQESLAQTITLEPGDVLRVLAWREKDLNGEYPVDEVGRLTLPLLGVYQVIGMPWPKLRDSLLADYQRQLKNPSVVLTPLRRVWVLGEVNKPGKQLADPTMSLAGLIAMAGGATPGGDLHRVRVVRDGKTIVKSASVESLLLQPVHSNDQIFVDRRAWIERNGAFVASAVISTAGILIALIRR
jgi:protein involved in polysaccharide export with SLBB domain